MALRLPQSTQEWAGRYQHTWVPHSLRKRVLCACRSMSSNHFFGGFMFRVANAQRMLDSSWELNVPAQSDEANRYSRNHCWGGRYLTEIMESRRQVVGGRQVATRRNATQSRC